MSPRIVCSGSELSEVDNTLATLHHFDVSKESRRKIAQHWGRGVGKSQTAEEKIEDTGTPSSRYKGY